MSDKELQDAILKGKLKEVLASLPRERWLECDDEGRSKWLVPAIRICEYSRDKYSIQELILSGVSLELPFGESIFKVKRMPYYLFTLICRLAKSLPDLITYYLF